MIESVVGLHAHTQLHALHDLERESTALGLFGLVVTLLWKDEGRVRNTVAFVANGTKAVTLSVSASCTFVINFTET